MKIHQKLLIVLFFVVTCFSTYLFSANIVVELLVQDEDNKKFGPKEHMHMTIGHLTYSHD